MPLVIPPGFAHVAVEHRADGDPDPWYCTFGIDTSDAGAAYPDIALKIINAWAVSWENIIGTFVTFSGVQLTVGQDGAEELRLYFPFDTFEGLNTSQKLPQNCAMLIKKQTLLGGRRNRGRMFIPGAVDEDQVSNTGVINSPKVTEWGNAAQLFVDNLADPAYLFGAQAAIPMVLLHSTGNTPTGDPTPVAFATCDNVISTQRRRLR